MVGLEGQRAADWLARKGADIAARQTPNEECDRQRKRAVKFYKWATEFTNAWPSNTARARRKKTNTKEAKLGRAKKQAEGTVSLPLLHRDQPHTWWRFGGAALCATCYKCRRCGRSASDSKSVRQVLRSACNGTVAVRLGKKWGLGDIGGREDNEYTIVWMVQEGGWPVEDGDGGEKTRASIEKDRMKAAVTKARTRKEEERRGTASGAEAAKGGKGASTTAEARSRVVALGRVGRAAEEEEVRREVDKKRGRELRMGGGPPLTFGEQEQGMKAAVEGQGPGRHGGRGDRNSSRT